MICGHCHGQRIPEPTDRIQSILSQRDPFNAGDDLSRFYRPIDRDSHIGPVAFASRFWPNSSPRLTAYEYQGILRSKCFVNGEAGKRINCLTCHTMHGGDPKGQITDENRTDKPCLACHQQFGQTKALVAHTGHGAESAGSRCYNCHLPRVVYGIMAFHRTHDITVPEPQLTADSGVPNACNQCHLDRSVNWSITEAKRIWPQRFAGAQLSADDQFNLPEGPRALFAGDALTRALAADLMSGNGPTRPDPGWASPFLVEAFADKYPIVRFFAANGIDATGSSLERRQAGLPRPAGRARGNVAQVARAHDGLSCERTRTSDDVVFEVSNAATRDRPRSWRVAVDAITRQKRERRGFNFQARQCNSFSLQRSEMFIERAIA